MFYNTELFFCPDICLKGLSDICQKKSLILEIILENKLRYRFFVLCNYVLMSYAARVLIYEGRITK